MTEKMEKGTTKKMGAKGRRKRHMALGIAVSVLAVMLLTGCGGEKPGKADTDTLRWFNASYALITTLNKGDLSYVAGFKPGTMIKTTMQTVLERDWDVTDRESLEETIDWLLSEGHNRQALDYLDDSGAVGLGRDELIVAMAESGFEQEDVTVLLSIFDAEAAYGQQAIAGWDLSRAMSLIGWGYLADYYTYEEAMDKSLETAELIQQKFDSWEDFMDSYFYGYSYWSEEDPEDASSQASSRRQVYEELKADNVYSVEWNLAFVKEW